MRQTFPLLESLSWMIGYAVTRGDISSRYAAQVFILFPRQFSESEVTRSSAEGRSDPSQTSIQSISSATLNSTAQPPSLLEATASISRDFKSVQALLISKCHKKQHSSLFTNRKRIEQKSQVKMLDPTILGEWILPREHVSGGLAFAHK